MERKVLRKEYRVLGFPLWDFIRTEMSLTEVVSTPEKRQPRVIKQRAPIFIVGTWFLEDCYKYLCKKPVESMHYVSGLRFENYCTLERITKFNLSSQSAASVKGDLSSSFKSLMSIEKRAYHLNAWCHSHPGKGQESVFVSGTDLKTQRSLEQGKYEVIGLIFSQDGYIRAFSDALDFKLMVLGKGVKGVDENIYKISET